MILMQNVVAHELAIIIVSAVLGVISLAGSLEGWMFRDLGKGERVLFMLFAILAIHPSVVLSLASTSALIVFLIYAKKTAPKFSAV